MSPAKKRGSDHLGLKNGVMPVRQRSVSFVYQQFINYPAMSVFDNIASPLKIQKIKPSKAEVKTRVEE